MTAALQQSTASRALRTSGRPLRHMAGLVRWNLPVGIVLVLLAAIVLWALFTQWQALAPDPASGKPAGLAAAPAAAPPAAPVAANAIRLAELPALGQQVYKLIYQGGPFAFDKDGVVFGNREGQLPRQPRGYYREYTVARPDADNRGPRRIVCGGAQRQPEVCYYTADHYNSFKKIIP